MFQNDPGPPKYALELREYVKYKFCSSLFHSSLYLGMSTFSKSFLDFYLLIGYLCRSSQPRWQRNIAHVHSNVLEVEWTPLFSLLWQWSGFSLQSEFCYYKIVAKDLISISTDGCKGNWLIALIDKVDRYDGIKLIAHWKSPQDRLLVLNRRTTGGFKILK